MRGQFTRQRLFAHGSAYAVWALTSLISGALTYSLGALLALMMPVLMTVPAVLTFIAVYRRAEVRLAAWREALTFGGFATLSLFALSVLWSAEAWNNDMAGAIILGFGLLGAPFIGICCAAIFGSVVSLSNPLSASAIQADDRPS